MKENKGNKKDLKELKEKEENNENKNKKSIDLYLNIIIYQILKIFFSLKKNNK